MKIYRFAVHPEENGYYYLECINDPRLFTQARSLDEAAYMARDVAATVYGEQNVQVELVVPPDVVTPFERRKKARRSSTSTKRRRRTVATR